MKTPMSLLPWRREDAALAGLRQRLYRMAYAWTHDPHLANDLAQEALARGLAHRDQLRDPAALPAWSMTILNNCWRDHLRRKHPDEAPDALEELVDTADGPEDLAGREQSVQRVRRAVARLPLGQRQVLTLVDLEGCSYADVARILDIAMGTVMSRLARARVAVRAALEATSAAQPPAALRRVK